MNKDDEIKHLQSMLTRLIERSVHPPLVAVDDSGVLNRISDYVEKTKRLTKRDLKKIIGTILKKGA